MHHSFIAVLIGTVGIVVGAGVWPPTAEAFGSEPESPPASIVVRTYTQADSAGAIATARRTAGAILGRAGVTVAWIECGLPGAATAAAEACGRPLQSNELLVRIVAAGAEDRGHQATTLGFAVVDLDAGGGSLATVYADRVGRMASSAGVDAAELLGKAIAHEIGHLLLGTNRHASRGLMRASWSRTDLRRSLADQWLFGGSDSDVMRKGIAGRLYGAGVPPGRRH
jgi:hypothetical protein